MPALRGHAVMEECPETLAAPMRQVSCLPPKNRSATRPGRATSTTSSSGHLDQTLGWWGQVMTCRHPGWPPDSQSMGRGLFWDPLGWGQGLSASPEACGIPGTSKSSALQPLDPGLD